MACFQALASALTRMKRAEPNVRVFFFLFVVVVAVFFFCDRLVVVITGPVSIYMLFFFKILQVLQNARLVHILLDLLFFSYASLVHSSVPLIPSLRQVCSTRGDVVLMPESH